MTNSKPIQVNLFSQPKEIKSVRDKYIAGMALMENGKILPIIWDGQFSFQIYDPINEVWAEFANRLFGDEPDPKPMMPEYAKDYAKRMEAIKRITGEKVS